MVSVSLDANTGPARSFAILKSEVKSSATFVNFSPNSNSIFEMKFQTNFG